MAPRAPANARRRARGGDASGRGPAPRERILTAALTLFRRDGINATGVSELAAAARVSKRTLYHHFAAKDDVVLAYLRAFEDDPALGPEAPLSREELAPRARMLELFTALGEANAGFRGCPFVAAALERPDPRDPVHRLAAAHKLRFIDQLTELARAAGARPAEQVARRLAVLYDGAAAQTMVRASAEPAAEAFALAAAVINTATAG